MEIITLTKALPRPATVSNKVQRGGRMLTRQISSECVYLKPLIGNHGHGEQLW